MAMIPSPNPSLPPYIERGGEVVYSPPGFARGVHMYAYLLRADTDRLQQMFHRYLNEPGGGAVDIVPAGSTVVLNVVRLDRVGALTMPDHARGYFSELEMAVWTLAYDRRSGRYLTFVPYMVVDRGSAMAMGREVYGFPKQLGVVSFPDEQERAFRVDVDAVRTWDADTEFTRQRLVTIPSVQTQFGQPPVDFTTQEQLVRELARAAADDRGLLSVATGAGTSGDLDHLAGAVQLLVSRTLPMVFLKQIRDCPPADAGLLPGDPHRQLRGHRLPGGGTPARQSDGPPRRLRQRPDLP